MLHLSWKATLSALTASLLLAACGGHSDGSVNLQADCSQEGQKKALYGIMQDAYLWYTEVPDLDPTSYKNLDTLLEALTYKKYDKWSYLTTQGNYDNYFNNGKYIGFGFSLGLVGSRVYLKVVFEGSPAYKAGLRRGMEILEINGKSIEEIRRGNLWGSIYGGREVGVEGTFKLKSGGESRSVTVKKEEVTSYSILYDKLWEVDGEKVGYFVFNKFIEPSKTELAAQFRKFKDEGVSKLILDLRYNGGGRIHIAQYLASLIAGKTHHTKVVASLKYNDRYTHWNEKYRLTQEKNALELSTLYVITTGASCSASELLINGLKPFVDVKVIGEHTCGKPVGMRGYSFCGTHLSPIQFEVFNAEEAGRYYGGLAPDCTVADDLTHPFGDHNEAMLQEALYVLKHDRCSRAASEKSVKKRASTSAKYMHTGGWQREIGAQ